MRTLGLLIAEKYCDKKIKEKKINKQKKKMEKRRKTHTVVVGPKPQNMPEPRRSSLQGPRKDSKNPKAEPTPSKT